MKNNNIKTKFIFLAIIFFGFFGLAKSSQAAEYYVSPTGSGITCSTGYPCNIDYCIDTKMDAGDTCWLKDGIYQGVSNMLDVDTNGKNGIPKFIKAVNDGLVIIDGEDARIPCQISGTDLNRRHDIQIEGIICKNSSASVVAVNYSDRVTVKRVSADNTATENWHNFQVNKSTYVTLEDCAAYGEGRVNYLALESSHITFRRCWSRHSDLENPNPVYATLSFYGTSDGIAENCLFTKVPSSLIVNGMNDWRHTYSSATDRNKMYGNIVYDLVPYGWGYKVESATHLIQDNKFDNNVSINNRSGLFQRADKNLFVNHLTVIGTTGQASNQDQDDSWGAKDGDWGMIGVVKNSVFLSNVVAMVKSGSDPVGTTLTSRYNTFYNNTTQYSGTILDKTGDNTINPNYDTATYGKGAYLMVPSALKGKGENGADIGAEILYKYVNGQKTSESLWPWPMEDRIKNETGYSVTYESDGGIWKTLDGVYSDTTPPSAPSELSVQ